LLICCGIILTSHSLDSWFPFLRRRRLRLMLFCCCLLLI
jgi:hypothetical protein